MKKSELRQVIREEYRAVIQESDLYAPISKLRKTIVDKIKAAQSAGTISSADATLMRKELSEAFNTIATIYEKTYGE